MAATALQTQRLLLAPFQSEYVAPLFAIMRDASSMKHTYVAPSLEHCKARLSAYEAMRPTLGFAPWVIRTSHDLQVVGWGGLSVDPKQPEWGLEVGYAFSPAAWGQGYATELVQFSLGHAFSVLAAHAVHAFAKPENEPSIRVLQKSGFKFLRFEPALGRNYYLVNTSAA